MHDGAERLSVRGRVERVADAFRRRRPSEHLNRRRRRRPRHRASVRHRSALPLLGRPGRRRPCGPGTGTRCLGVPPLRSPSDSRLRRTTSGSGCSRDGRLAIGEGWISYPAGQHRSPNTGLSTYAGCRSYTVVDVPTGRRRGFLPIPGHGERLVDIRLRRTLQTPLYGGKRRKFGSRREDTGRPGSSR